MGAGDLAPLARLPHTTAYVGSGPGAGELQARFLRHLRADLERRRAAPGGRRAVVLIDGLAALRDEYQDFEGQLLLDALHRVYAEGPALGISFAVSTTRAKAVPSAMDEVTTQKWLFRLADPYDYSSIGVRPKDVPPPVPGRFIDSTMRLQSHVATPTVPLDRAVADVAAAWPEAPTKTSAVGRLPDAVRVGDLAEPARFDAEPWRLPVGIAEDDLGTAVLEVYDGEHVLVAGPRGPASRRCSSPSPTSPALPRASVPPCGGSATDGRPSPKHRSTASPSAWTRCPHSSPDSASNAGRSCCSSTTPNGSRTRTRASRRC